MESILFILWLCAAVKVTCKSDRTYVRARIPINHVHFIWYDMLRNWIRYVILLKCNRQNRITILHHVMIGLLLIWSPHTVLITVVTLQSCKYYQLLSLCGCLFEGCVWWMYVTLQSCKHYHLLSLYGCLFDVCGECTSHCNHVNTINCCLFVDAFLMCVVNVRHIAIM